MGISIVRRGDILVFREASFLLFILENCGTRSTSSNERERKMFFMIIYKHVSRENSFQLMADELVNEELDNNGFKQKWRR